MNSTTNVSLVKEAGICDGSDTLPFSSQVVYFLCSGILVVFVCGGNLLTILAIALTPSLQTLANMYITSLAVADFLNGCLAPVQNFPYNHALSPMLGCGREACLLVNSMAWLSNIASMMSLLLVSADRYLYIVHPFLYPVLVTSARSLAAIGVIWVVSALLAFVPYYFNNWRPGTLCYFLYVWDKSVIAWLPTALFVSSIPVVLWLHLSIAHVAYKLRNAVHPLTQAPSSRQQFKAVKMVVVVFGVYFACWTPVHIFFHLKYSSLSASLTWMEYAAWPLPILNSGLNFLIYAWMMPDFRRAFKRLLGCSCLRAQNDLDDGTTRNSVCPEQEDSPRSRAGQPSSLQKKQGAEVYKCGPSPNEDLIKLSDLTATTNDSVVELGGCSPSSSSQLTV